MRARRRSPMCPDTFLPFVCTYLHIIGLAGLAWKARARTSGLKNCRTKDKCNMCANKHRQPYFFLVPEADTSALTTSHNSLSWYLLAALCWAGRGLARVGLRPGRLHQPFGIEHFDYYIHCFDWLVSRDRSEDGYCCYLYPCCYHRSNSNPNLEEELDTHSCWKRNTVPDRIPYYWD